MKTLRILKMLAALALTAAISIPSHAADPNQILAASGQNITVEDGTSITTETSGNSNGAALLAWQGGTITVNGSAELLAKKSAAVTVNTSADYSQNSTIDLGSGTSATSINGGYTVRMYGGTVTGTNLNLVIGDQNDPTQTGAYGAVCAELNGNINVGSDSVLTSYLVGSGGTAVVRISTGASFTAVRGLVVNSYNDTMHAVRSSGNNSDASIVTKVDLGDGAKINAYGSGSLGIHAQISTEVTASNATIYSEQFAAVRMGYGSLVTLTDSSVTGTEALQVATATTTAFADGFSDKTAVTNFNGGTIVATNGSVIRYTEAAAEGMKNYNTEINLYGGVVATSSNGILADHTQAHAVNSINIYDSGTVANGRIVGTSTVDGVLNVSIKGAKWVSTGESTMNSLDLDGANILLTLDSTDAGVHVVDGGLSYGADMNQIAIRVTDELIQGLIDSGVFQADFGILTGGGDVPEANVTWDFQTSNSFAKWIWVDLGDGYYRITITEIPEISGYAAVFGLLALALAAVRRRNWI